MIKVDTIEYNLRKIFSIAKSVEIKNSNPLTKSIYNWLQVLTFSRSSQLLPDDRENAKLRVAIN